MKIYVVRHGQTDMNIQGRLQGRNGLPLNAVGISQAEKSAAELRDVGFGLVYSSPQARAVQTAEIISGKKEIIKDCRIDVFDVGEADGKIIADLGEMEFGLIPDAGVFGGVESTDAFLIRVFAFMDEVVSEYRDKKINVLIAGHKCTTGAIDCYFNGLPVDGDFFSRSSKNGKYKIYEVSKTGVYN